MHLLSKVSPKDPILQVVTQVFDYKNLLLEQEVHVVVVEMQVVQIVSHKTQVFVDDYAYLPTPQSFTQLLSKFK